MRIAMFTNNYKPYTGGVPVSVCHLADALRRLGHEVYIFAPTYEDQTEEKDVIRYPSFPVKIAGAPVPDVWTGLFEKKIKELKIDVIHVHHPALVGNVALFMKRKYKIPVVFTYHTRYEEYLYYVKPLQIMEKYTGVLERYLNWFFNRCDLILTPTPGMKKYLESRPVFTPREVLPTGIGESGFSPDAADAAEISKHYKKDADYLFCTIARLAREKNILFQLEALSVLKKQLEKKQKTFRYLIIGEGPQRKELERRIAQMNLRENVCLAGNVAHERIAAFLKASDAFLFSSKSETQGIVILEAMAAAKPVVAVRASGVEDIVEDGVNGYLTEENKVQWAECVEMLMEEKERYEKMCAAAYGTAETYREETIAKKAASLYEQVILNVQNSQTMVPYKEKPVL